MFIHHKRYMSKVIKTINTILGPKAIGPYSSARVYNGVMYVSGNIGIDPSTSQLVSEDVEQQTRQSMQNLKAILTQNNLTFDHVLRATIYLKSMDDFTKINQIYAEYFKNGSYPARVCIAVSTLPKNAKFQIEATVAYPHALL